MFLKGNTGISEKIRLGISPCLLGDNVRYNGVLKGDPFLMKEGDGFIEWVRVCPEVECGLPVPREAIQLEGNPASPRLMTVETRLDLTDCMQTWINRRLSELENEGLCGFILKARSPSCGEKTVNVFCESGEIVLGSGLFARAFKERFPDIPTIDEENIRDELVRRNFTERVFACRARQKNHNIPQE